MPEMFSPSMSEWTEVQSWLSDLRARTTQIELFHAEMDGRQAVAEDTLTVHGTTLAGHNGRTAALESWRKSADATMVFTEKKILAVESELPTLAKSVTALNDSVSRLTDSVSRIMTSLTTLTETVSMQISKLSTLEARIAACEKQLQLKEEGGEDVSKRV